MLLAEAVVQSLPTGVDVESISEGGRRRVCVPGPQHSASDFARLGPGNDDGSSHLEETAAAYG